MRQAAPYSKISKRCLLCLYEKLAIALYPNPEELRTMKYVPNAFQFVKSLM